MSEAMQINMDSELMQPLRTDMDMIMNRCLKTMHSTNNGEAVVTAKIKITLEREGVPTENGMRASIRPKFEHEVQSVIQAKDKKTGAMVGDYELVYDPEIDQFVARSTKTQVTMFDDDLDVNGESQQEGVAGHLEAPVYALEDGEEDQDGSEDMTDDDEIADGDPDSVYEVDESPDYEPDEDAPEE